MNRTKRILLSFVLVGTVATLAGIGSRAFFSDTETSTGNVLSAGSVDLKIDSECEYYQDGLPVGCDGFGTWESTDLTNERFYNFGDVKPGDWGENTISLTVVDNPAWACMHIGNMVNSENDLIDPEVEAGDITPAVGELSENLHFTAWLDQGATPGWQGKDEDQGEGDNVWQGETAEPLLFSNEQGPASDVLGGKTYTLADSAFGGALAGNVTHYIGLQWCAGTMTIDGSTITCDGSTMGNESQTDSISADMSFYVEQERNNSDFTCSDVEWPAEEAVTYTVTPNNYLGWFFYNDETDVIDNTLGTFVAGPSSPLAGVGSAEMTVSGTQRRNLATYQFSGTPLADITELKFSTYQPSTNTGNDEYAAYLNFNVDFDGSDTWQRRLVFVPRVNGAVSQDTWQTWDAFDGGTALWSYSGPTWPVTGEPGTTTKTWNQILADYPLVRVRVTDSWLGMRVGEPYAEGFTGNVDKFTIGVSGVTSVFDFEQ